MDLLNIAFIREHALTLYLAITGVAGLGILWWLKISIEKVQEKRLTRIEDVEHFNPIPTRTPLKNPKRRARQAALQSILSRFSIIRRLLLVGLFILWGIALSFPFLGEFPARLVSLLGAGGAIVLGIAAKPVVENIIAGMMISFSGELRTGDTVKIDDHYGTVEDISLTHTTIKIWDWRRYIIPNIRMLTKEFINYTVNDTFIWAYVTFWVAYDADMDTVEAIAVNAARESEYFAGRESPRFWTMEMEKESVQCWVAAWAESPAEAWLLRAEIRRKMAQGLKAAGIRPHVYQHRMGEDEILHLLKNQDGPMTAA